MSTHRALAETYADLAAKSVVDKVDPRQVQVVATLAAAYASLAVAEELAKFDAVAVEERKP